MIEYIHFTDFFALINGVFPEEYKYKSGELFEDKYILTDNPTIYNYINGKNRAADNFSDSEQEKGLTKELCEAFLNKLRFFLYPEKRVVQQVEISCSPRFVVLACIDIIAILTRHGACSVNFSFLNIEPGSQTSDFNLIIKHAIDQIYTEILYFFKNAKRNCVECFDLKRFINILFIKYRNEFFTKNYIQDKRSCFSVDELEILMRCSMERMSCRIRKKISKYKKINDILKRRQAYVLINLQQTMKSIKSLISVEKFDELDANYKKILTQYVSEVIRVEKIFAFDDNYNLEKELLERIEPLKLNKDWKKYVINAVIYCFFVRLGHDEFGGYNFDMVYGKSAFFQSFHSISLAVLIEYYVMSRDKCIEGINIFNSWYGILSEIVSTIDYADWMNNNKYTKYLLSLFEIIGMLFHCLSCYGEYSLIDEQD